MRHHGFTLSRRPLTLIRPLEYGQICGSQTAVVILNSATTVFQLKPRDLAGLSSRPLYVVGHRTAEAAHARGFSQIAAICATGQQLADQLRRNLSKAQKILYLTGRVRHDKFLSLLQGYPIETYEIYDTIANLNVKPLSSPAHIVLLYSALAARNIALLGSGLTEKTQFLCLSKRIAAALPEKWQHQTHSATLPREKSLFLWLKND